ncbi:MAG: hypothetical protein ABW046_16970 [Actinoplanes sp.]
MVRSVHVAYLSVFLGLFLIGFFTEASWWVTALIGVAVMIPVAVADFVTSKKRKPQSA